MTLSEWREKKGMTQTAVAELLEVEPSMWSKWERGVVSPTLEHAVKILDVTGGDVTLAELAKRGPGGR